MLCVFPAYTPSFGTFAHAYPLMRRVRAFMPPQGLLLIAAYLPASWPVRFVDENIRPAERADFAWADVVLISGMHIQAAQIRDIAALRRRNANPDMVKVVKAYQDAELQAVVDYMSRLHWPERSGAKQGG